MKVERGKKPQPTTVLILNIYVWGPLLKGEREIEGTREDQLERPMTMKGWKLHFPIVSFHFIFNSLNVGTHHIVFVCAWKG